jgi:hypothetical protein
MRILVPISIGELLDKISILYIKLNKIDDKEKLKYIEEEYDELIYMTRKLHDTQCFVDRLIEVNNIIWEVEDQIRKKEKDDEFDKDFIELARSVYYNNDKRFKIKNEINEKFGSYIREQKDYEQYL